MYMCHCQKADYRLYTHIAGMVINSMIEIYTCIFFDSDYGMDDHTP